MLLSLLASGLLAICGTDRESIKVLADWGARHLQHGDWQATVEQLRGLPGEYTSHPEKPGWGMPRQKTEAQVVSVEASVVGTRIEPDGDIHVVIAGAAPGATMITEFPDAACVKQWMSKTTKAPKTVLAQMQQDAVAMEQAKRKLLSFLPFAPTTKYRALPKPWLKLRFTGVLFFDRPHKQTGVAPNGIELHPVLQIQRPLVP